MSVLLQQAREAIRTASSSAVSAAERCHITCREGSIASTKSNSKENHGQGTVRAEWCPRGQDHAIGRWICADQRTVIYFMSWNR